MLPGLSGRVCEPILRQSNKRQHVKIQLQEVKKLNTPEGQNLPYTEEEKKRLEEEQEQEEKEDKAEKIAKKIKKSEKSVRSYQFFALRLFLLVFVLWIFLFKVVGITQMPNSDMYPRIDAGDLVLFYRLDKDIRAQDIIVISKETPDTNGEKHLWIARVIAVAGDTVEITGEQQVKVNGNALVESNIFYQTPPYADYTEYPVTVGEGEYFVLSDSRANGTDSRVFGVVTREDFVGTVITILRRSNL
ncbi:MAG: signal peptidase I [Clostridiales bacterium]|nr:signal peptidase I [Clostridiales bacterium]